MIACWFIFIGFIVQTTKKEKQPVICKECALCTQQSSGGITPAQAMILRNMTMTHQYRR